MIWDWPGSGNASISILVIQALVFPAPYFASATAESALFRSIR